MAEAAKNSDGVRFVEPDSNPVADKLAEKQEAKPEPKEQESHADTEAEKAQAAGWRPKDEWDGDPSEWVSAKEFNKRGELFESIRSLKKQSAEDRKTLEKLAEHNKKIAQQLRQQRIEELEERKAAAVDVADRETVKAIDKQIKAIDKEDEPEKPTIDKEVQEWGQRNPWAESNAALRLEAAAIHQSQLDRGLHQYRPIGDLLDEVSEEMKRRHPEVFGGEKEPRRQTVETPSNRGTGKRKPTFADLNDNEKKAARAFIKRGVFKNEQEYMQQLQDVGEKA